MCHLYILKWLILILYIYFSLYSFTFFTFGLSTSVHLISITISSLSFIGIFADVCQIVKDQRVTTRMFDGLTESVDNDTLFRRVSNHRILVHLLN